MRGGAAAAAVGASAAWALGAGAAPGQSSRAVRTASRLASADTAFLEELERAAFTFFTESAHPASGQVLDRRRADGGREERRVASIAATGFGLTGLCLADARGWARGGSAREQTRRTLRFLRHEMPHEHGFFYHFHDWETGARVWECEVSSIDTSILLCGVLSCGAYFREDEEIRRWATELYERVDWTWMLNGGAAFSMGWRPESGFLSNRWDHYCELMMLYLLALGSPTHPVGPETWRAWSRPIKEYYGQRYVWSPAPLFVHQYSHAWFPFSEWREAVGDFDWFANSVAATRAHLGWSRDQAERFPQWSEDLWGVSSSDSVKGYVGWGGPPDQGPLDGTIVPCAAAGSLPFLPESCLRTLRFQRSRFGERIWGRYGLVDAFNPHTGWVNPDVIGIDVGISWLMAENLRSGRVWQMFGTIPAVRRGLERAGFKRR